MYGDPSGETRLGEVQLSDGPGALIPAVALRIGEPRQLPFHDFHPAPARGLVVVLRGEYEIVTTSGDRKRFHPGEWLFADDVGTKGHTSQGFGEVQMMHCQVPDDWDDWTQL